MRIEAELREMLAFKKGVFEKAKQQRDLSAMDVIGNQVNILEWVLGAEIQGPYLVTADSQHRVLGFSPWPESSG